MTQLGYLVGLTFHVRIYVGLIMRTSVWPQPAWRGLSVLPPQPVGGVLFPTDELGVLPGVCTKSARGVMHTWIRCGLITVYLKMKNRQTLKLGKLVEIWLLMTCAGVTFRERRNVKA